MEVLRTNPGSLFLSLTPNPHSLLPSTCLGSSENTKQQLVSGTRGREGTSAAGRPATSPALPRPERALTTTQFSECTMWTGPLAFRCVEEWMIRPVTPSTRKMPMKVRSWCPSVLSVTTASRLGFRLWAGGGRAPSEPQGHMVSPGQSGLLGEVGFWAEDLPVQSCHHCTRTLSAGRRLPGWALPDTISLNPTNHLAQ